MDAAKSGSRPGRSAATWLADAKPTPTVTSTASGAPWKKASTSPSRQPHGDRLYAKRISTGRNKRPPIG
jgi:hypothetical protein